MSQSKSSFLSTLLKSPLYPLINIIDKFVNSFKNIRIKLIVSFSLIIIMLSTVALLPLVLYKKPIDQFDNMIKNTVYFSDIIKSCNEIVAFSNIYSRAKNSEIANRYQVEVNKLNMIIDNITNNDNVKVPKDRLVSIKNNVNLLVVESKNIIENKSKNPLDDVEKIRTQNDSLVREVKNLTMLEIEMNKQLGNQANELVNRTTIISISLILFIGLICILTTMIISKNISEPVLSITKAADKIADGNIISHKYEINTKDELSQLNNSFVRMTNNLKEIILSVRETSININNYSQQLGAGTNESSAASQEIASAAQQVTDAAATQLEIIKKVSVDIEGMYRVIEVIAGKVLSAGDSAQNAMRVADEGTKSIQNGITQIRNINTSISNSVEILEHLKNQSEQIVGIIEIIHSIASQTNLLSLNAAIEAARAGEAGKGFGVVAQEIRKLADHSVESTRQITDRIQNIQNITSSLSESMNSGVTEIKAGIGVIEDAGAVFEKIKASVAMLNTFVNQNNEGIKEILTLTENIKGSSDNIIEVSKTFTLSSEGVASAAEQLSSIMEDNLSAAQRLSGVSAKLNALVEKFNV